MNIYIHGHRLTFVEHPLYAVAHPGEPTTAGERCTLCALARRADTGEVVLLWLCGGINWSVSRFDANHERHRAELGPPLRAFVDPDAQRFTEIDDAKGSGYPADLAFSFTNV